MKSFECSSDIGSVLVGNKDVRFALPNIGGDGLTIFEVYEKDEEVPKEYKFVTCIEGEFNVYSYDCSDGNEEDIITTLKGRFGVFKSDWIVAVKQWS